jgi:hypothetical protein
MQTITETVSRKDRFRTTRGRMPIDAGYGLFDAPAAYTPIRSRATSRGRGKAALHGCRCSRFDGFSATRFFRLRRRCDAGWLLVSEH